MANGGKRPGAGRKVGAKSLKTKARLARTEAALNKAGVMPLEVMLLAMQQAWAAAHDESLTDDVRATNRRAALDAAKDAAPYVHPKLQPVDSKGSSEQAVNLNLIVKFA